MTTRPANWPELLAAHFAEWSLYPFSYGSHDCVHFAAAWLRRLGYADPLAGLHAWASPLSAARVWKSLGGFEHGIGAQLGALGCQQIAPAKAMRGDLVLVRNGPHGRQVLAIADGADAVAHGDKCSVQIPVLKFAVTAWRV